MKYFAALLALSMLLPCSAEAIQPPRLDSVLPGAPPSVIRYRRRKARWDRLHADPGVVVPDSGIHPDATVPDSGDAGIWPDATVPDSGDAGIWPDAAPPDSGDGGQINLAVLTGPSYFHEGGGTPQTPVWTDAGVGAYQVVDGSVVAAVDRAGAAASIGAIQIAAASSGQQWVLADYQLPQTEPWNYDLAALEASLTVASAWAADAGTQLCPRGHWDMVGGYYTGSVGLPFQDGGTSLAPDAGSHMEIVGAIAPRMLAHLAMLSDAGTYPGVSADCVAALPYYDLKGPQPGTMLDSGLQQMPYSGDFLQYTSTAPLLDTSGFEVQTDGLHFNQRGHQEAAQALSRTLERARIDGTATRFAPTALAVVDATTIDVTFQVPCRVHGGCIDDPPLLIDVSGRVPQETLGAIDSYGLHFWSGSTLLQPGVISSATPQTCTSPATECDVRFVFASLPNFDSVSFGDTFCKIFGNADCSFGPAGKYAGGSNVVSRTDSVCTYPVDGGTDCVEQPVGGRWTVSPYDSGVAPDAGFAASNTQYLAATSGNYVTVANQGGGSAQCVFAWGDLPVANLDTIFTANTTLRGFLGNIGGTWGCAISNTGPTYRTATGTYSTGTRYDVACCYDGTSGPTGIKLYVAGADVSGTTNGAATVLTTDGVTNIPDNAAATNVDEVVVMPGKTDLTAGERLQLRCATKASTDSSPTSGECTGVVTDISAICALATGTRWYGFEGDATDRCSVLNGVEVGTVPYATY